MRAAGLDIGSRTVELVVVEGDTVVASARADTTPMLKGQCRRLLAGAAFDRLVVTGYGRALAEVEFDAESVTEIRACARGAHALFPGCRSVLDIGGQDTKAIGLDGRGRVLKFEMNDRCAAGAGKFLEMMARALAYDLEEFGVAALAGVDGIRLNSMCAVFAESEVVGLVTRGERREDIARAVHHAVARRSAAMLQRVSTDPPIVFAGGGARSASLVALLKQALGMEVLTPADPDMVGALGAALLARER
ncbi:MAG: 3-hydroxyacyl-ACP dehydratase [Armatimonadetes bacterium]|nr:3-hydroxyacyl-ACP dehydratase [Armatimonadota bacterium]